MPFQKGQSGNPGGRPKAYLSDERSLSELAREHTAEAVETLAALMRNTGTPAAARIAAASTILERGWGRPTQAVAIAAAVEPAYMDPDEARATIVRFLEQMRQKQIESGKASEGQDSPQ